MTEAELLDEVIKLADASQVLYFHSTDSRRDRGKGFPDLVLAGSERTMFAELKSAIGDTRAEQTAWKWRLKAAGIRYALWRPSHLADGTIEAQLKLLHLPGWIG